MKQTEGGKNCWPDIHQDSLSFGDDWNHFTCIMKTGKTNTNSETKAQTSSNKHGGNALRFPKKRSSAIFGFCLSRRWRFLKRLRTRFRYLHGGSPCSLKKDGVDLDVGTYRWKNGEVTSRRVMNFWKIPRREMEMRWKWAGSLSTGQVSRVF